MQTAQQNLLTGPELNLLVRASTGKRFANYLIDLLGFYITLFVLGFMIAVAFPPAIDALEDDSGFGLLGRLISVILYGLYMFSIEAIFKGKSFGKLVTGTKAVNEDGSQISLRTAFLRGLSRMVPFEAFSALGTPSYPWHDKWTRTVVIDEKASIKSEY
jgi:uncharacterized RDD family membrane protein YckC